MTSPETTETGWRTIESAPKDGSLILLCDARIEEWQLTAFYVDDDSQDHAHVWHTLDGLSYHRDAFTHWLRLPSPPQGMKI